MEAAQAAALPHLYQHRVQGQLADAKLKPAPPGADEAREIDLAEDRAVGFCQKSAQRPQPKPLPQLLHLSH